VSAAESPILRVVNADATPEEIAAIVAVFASLGAAPESTSASRRSDWAAPHRMQRATGWAGPGAWRASGLPR
jgi:hypothetical protein